MENNNNLYSNASLYVGDINPDVTEASLFEIFNVVAPVASIRVCRDAITHRSLGYAYVNYHSEFDAERALDTLNLSSIKGRNCRIMWSQRDPALRKSGVGNVFVKNLAKSIDTKSFFDTFSQFGNILSCKIATDEKGKSLGYGFVHYDSKDGATKAIEKVNGMAISGQQVTVAPFKQRDERDSSKSQFTNVYIKNLPESFTKEKLDDLFKKFGEITMSTIVADSDGTTKGFGFVNFNKPEDASAAVDELNEKIIEDKKIYVARAQKKSERDKELRDQFAKLKLERQKKYAGVNLYVKHIDDNVDDDQLREAFSKFGTITSAKVMKEKGRSLGFGFVCFSTPEEATKAVSQMNQKHLGSKPLFVGLAQSKEERRQQNEAQAQVQAKMGPGGNQPISFPAPQMYFPPGAQGMAPGRGGFMYPQMMPARGGGRSGGRWYPQNTPLPVPPGYAVRGQPGMAGTPYNMTQMVMANMRGRGGNLQQQRGQIPAGQKGQVSGTQAAVQYRSSARNLGRGPGGVHLVPVAQAGTPAQVTMPQVNSGGVQQPPLNLTALANAPVDQQKQMIGEQLFPLIHAIMPDLAGKITGMLLDLENDELLPLLESQKALNEKIQEALEVLQEHETQEQIADPNDSMPVTDKNDTPQK